jgi:hypothetical protein
MHAKTLMFTTFSQKTTMVFHGQEKIHAHFMLVNRILDELPSYPD